MKANAARNHPAQMGNLGAGIRSDTRAGNYVYSDLSGWRFW